MRDHSDQSAWTDRVFLHLEDQSERAAWIPRMLSTAIWARYQDQLAAFPDVQETLDELRFDIKGVRAGQPFRIHYSIVSDPDRFWRALNQGHPVAGVLLDQHILWDSRAGSKMFERIQAHLPQLVGDTVLMTAYPADVAEQLGWDMPHPQLFQKPVSVSKLTSWLLPRALPALDGDG